MRTDIYRLVTVSDGKSDISSINQVFSAMATGNLKSDLQLLNYYNEVPISYGASIVSVEDDGVELQVHEHQAVILKQHKATLVKSRHFQKELGVHCYATYVNVAKKTAVLQNFSYAQVRAEKREAVRVKVSVPVTVEFSNDKVAIRGNMIDISGNGISMNTEAVPLDAVNQVGHVYFAISGTELAVPGTLVKLGPEGAAGTVCIFQIQPNRATDNVIGQYIYKRQVEIIQELKDGIIE